MQNTDYLRTDFSLSLATLATPINKEAIDFLDLHTRYFTVFEFDFTKIWNFIGNYDHCDKLAAELFELTNS